VVEYPHRCPRCGCQNTVDHYGVKICDCCGLVFTSQEMDKALKEKKKWL
jgi:transcription initiation factor TFIIIB Brf1 subunit/transcription initiation factor TFIIB